MKHFNKFLILLALIGLSAGAFAQTALPQSGNLNGQYTATPGSSYSSPYNLTGTTIIWVNSGTATITGEISGSSSYVFGKEGAGTLILTGTNTYNGQTGISGGKLQVGNGTSGSINNTSGVQISTTSATLRFEPFGSVMTFDKVISGSGKVEKAGATCDLRFTKDHLYTGTTTVESGQLSIGYTTTTGSVTGDIIVNSGAVVYFSRSNDYTYSGVISGAGSVYKSYASSKLILTGVNTYTGLTRINGGTLQIGNGSTGSIANTSTVDFFYNPPDATLRFEPGADMVFSKVISGSGKVEYKGAEGGLLQKTLSFTAKNTYTGTTTIEQGYFQIGANSNSGEVAGDIILQGNHSHLCFSRTDSYTYAKNITGTGYSVDVNTWEQGNSYYTNGTVILTGNNTYTGKTRIYSGILQVGNGSSGSINNTSDVSLSGANSTLCFLPGGGMIFSKVITGNGKVEIKGPNNIYFTADNDYEGTTTIDPGVTLSIGNDTSTGAIAGDIINNGTLRFFRSNAYTYSGKISGTGDIMQSGASSASVLTLTGANTYTGITYIDASLVLGNGGSIANSSSVTFRQYANAKLTITGNKTIKALNSVSSSSTNAGTVDLGGNVLTIGTSGQSDGSGTFRGVFAGTSGSSVSKYGTGTFTFTGTDNTSTGSFTCTQGTVVLEGNWAGNFYKNAASTLTVTGNRLIGNNLTIFGGTTNFNLSAATPSRLTASGVLDKSGTNTLNITSIGSASSYVLIEAAGGGIDNTDNFTVNIPGYNASLVATGTELILNVTGVGIEETGRATSVQVFPNPTSGELRIESGELRMDNVEIFDIYGKNVGSKFPSKNLEGCQPKADGVVFDISHLQAGIYFLKIHTENGIVTRKVVKH